MSQQVKKIMKYNRNAPFYGVKIETFNHHHIKTKKEIKKLTANELGVNIKEFNCPTSFIELQKRLWIHFRTDVYCLIRDKDTAYDMFVEWSYIILRYKINSWKPDITKKSSGSFWGWCTKTMKNFIIDESRNKIYKNNNLIIHNGNIEEFNTIQGDNDIDEFYEELHKKETIAVMLKEIKLLNEEDKFILHSIVLNKATVKETSEIMGISIGILTIKFNKIKRKLKHNIETTII